MKKILQFVAVILFLFVGIGSVTARDTQFYTSVADKVYDKIEELNNGKTTLEKTIIYAGYSEEIKRLLQKIDDGDVKKVLIILQKRFENDGNNGEGAVSETPVTGETNIDANQESNYSGGATPEGRTTLSSTYGNCSSVGSDWSKGRLYYLDDTRDDPICGDANFECDENGKIVFGLQFGPTFGLKIGKKLYTTKSACENMNNIGTRTGSTTGSTTTGTQGTSQGSTTNSTPTSMNKPDGINFGACSDVSSTWEKGRLYYKYTYSSGKTVCTDAIFACNSGGNIYQSLSQFGPTVSPVAGTKFYQTKTECIEKNNICDHVIRKSNVGNKLTVWTDTGEIWGCAYIKDDGTCAGNKFERLLTKSSEEFGKWTVSGNKATYICEGLCKETWGEKGFYMFFKGRNSCGESSVVKQYFKVN